MTTKMTGMCPCTSFFRSTVYSKELCQFSVSKIAHHDKTLHDVNETVMFFSGKVGTFRLSCSVQSSCSCNAI